MSTTFSVKPGDTFEKIARRAYGTEAEAYRIQEANPGVVEPLQGGAVLTVPALPNAPARRPQEGRTGSPDEVAVLIDGKRFRYWTSVAVSRSVDGFSTITLAAPYDADDPAFREAMRPFTYKPIQVLLGGVKVFSGTLVSPNPVVAEKERTIQASGYSRAGVLADCTAPESMYPLEFYDDDLKTIADRVTEPFGLRTTFLKTAGDRFGDGVNLNPEKKLWPFLVRLAKQRNLIIRDDDDGNLVFWVPPIAPAQPDAVLAQGHSPVISIAPELDPQQYYSHITGREPVFLGLGGETYTEKNDRLEGVLRPFTFEASDTSGATLQEATEAFAGRMFVNAAKYQVEVATWRRPDGEVWAAGDFVQLHAPDAMVYEPYLFLIREVTLARNEFATTASLQLIIPGSFRGEVPEKLPWDG